MNKKIILECDSSGCVYDKAGNIVGSLLQESVEYLDDSDPITVKQLLSLKEAGIEAEEIIKMKQAGII